VLHGVRGQRLLHPVFLCSKRSLFCFTIIFKPSLSGSSLQLHYEFSELSLHSLSDG
jgi:hypothetical protein